MAITLTNADSALKTVYLDAISEQLNFNVNPFWAAIEKSTENVSGKEVKKLAIHGVNGGIGAGTEDGDLPYAAGNNYAEFVSPLKNLYGVIEISDKALRASENNAGAFVSLLNAEMDGLIKASRFNFGRMLFGDGSGMLANVDFVAEGKVVVDKLDNIMEGMVIDICNGSGNVIISGRKITSIDRAGLALDLSGDEITSEMIPDNSFVTVQGSFRNEITGIKAIFDENITSLYGVNKEKNSWIKPYAMRELTTIDEDTIQDMLDSIEETSNSSVNFIICSFGVRKLLQKLLANNRSYIGTMELQGGYKAMSYNGIPIVADRFCPKGTMYFLNTNDFALHQLCDWQWLTGDDGKVLRQVPGKPIYTATLVKYAELICSRPGAQGAIVGITE